MEWLERAPLPQVCQTCRDGECDVCEHGLERWYLSAEYELELRLKLFEQSIARAMRKIKECDIQERQETMELNDGLIPVVKAEHPCDVYCPICHKLLHVEQGQVIPRCCGKVMEVMD